MANKYPVILQPSGQPGEVAQGTSLRAASRELGVDIESIYAENATCGNAKWTPKKAYSNATVIGGCCGPAPERVAAIAKAVKKVTIPQ